MKKACYRPAFLGAIHLEYANSLVVADVVLAVVARYDIYAVAPAGQFCGN